MTCMDSYNDLCGQLQRLVWTVLIICMDSYNDLYGQLQGLVWTVIVTCVGSYNDFYPYMDISTCMAITLKCTLRTVETICIKWIL